MKNWKSVPLRQFHKSTVTSRNERLRLMRLEKAERAEETKACQHPQKKPSGE